MSWNSSDGEAQFEVQPLGAVLELLPQDLWLVQNYKEDNGDQVALYRGDLTLDHLDLESGDDGVTLLLIQGNLTVKGNIFNENTDGAISLMVFGDLQAKNMAVGGQEIYVTGNLQVAEVLCGSYNHGETIVKGDLKAALLIADDYHFQIGGEKRTDILSDGQIEFVNFQGLPISLKEVLVEETFLEPDEYNESGFYFGCLFEVLRDGKSPLKDYLGYCQAKVNRIFSYFPNHLISHENMAKLMDCVLIPENQIGFEIREKELVFKFKKEHRDDEGQLVYANVFIDDGEYIFFVYNCPGEIELIYQKKSSEEAPWLPLEPETDLYRRFFLCWDKLLTAVCIGEYYGRKIDAGFIEGVMDHPKIQALDPDDDDNDGLWNGECFYRFRIFEDWVRPYPSIDIQTHDIVRYFFDAKDGRVVRFYKLNDEHSAEPISYFDLYHWERSQKYFEDLVKFVHEELG